MKQVSKLIQLERATFRPLINGIQKSLFQNPVTFSMNSNERWAIMGSHKEEFIKVLASQYVSEPPLARTYPFLHKEVWPSSVIQLLDFKGVLPTAHLSARYEFFKDEYDNTTMQFIQGYDYNSNKIVNQTLVKDVINKLKLNGLENRWVMGLSNGQMRRARIAKALINEPKMLIFDDPFLGLDPKASKLVDEILKELPPNPHIILGLTSTIPKWITHICIVDETGIVASGPTSELTPDVVREQIEKSASNKVNFSINKDSFIFKNRKMTENLDTQPSHIKFEDISIAYRGQPVLSNLTWEVKRGEKWHIRGNNGTGKSTLLSLITADHPQSWNSKVVIDGKPRKTGNQSYFGVNESIGFSSPELHSIFPGHLTVFQAIATGFKVSSFFVPNVPAEEAEKVNQLLKDFQVDDIRNKPFSDISVSDQKLVLFLRAIVKTPELLILDEALSVMVAHRINQCRDVVDNWQGTVLCIGHNAHEVPRCDKYIQLVSPGNVHIGTV